MPRKAFHIGIDVDVHAVSCPGVWLCPKGDVMLRISMLGASAHTKRVEPNFPLLFHETFHFLKTFTGITSLADLQSELTSRMVHIQLVQWQVHGCRCVVLAAFRSPLSELLYPQPATRGLMAGVDVDLLMETTACFPGIIAPKVEVSTKVVIEEMVNYPTHDHDSFIINHKTVTSKKTGFKREREEKPDSKTKSTMSSGLRSRLRQKPVCHTRPNVRCYYCKQKVERSRRGASRRGEGQCQCRGGSYSPTKKETLYIPYCNKCGDIVEEKDAKQGKILLKESSMRPEKWEAVCPCVEPPHSKSGCDCSLCHKYHETFKKRAVSPLEDSVVSPNLRSPKWRLDCSPSPTRKDKCCSYLDDKFGDIAASRQRSVSAHAGQGCPCVCYSSPADPLEKGYSDNMSDHPRRRQTKQEDYRDIFKADLDSHYKKLYERVSRRSNRRES